MSHTIIDIALLAGVSKSTVSRVISGKGYTSEEARKKVLNAIEELQYKPNGVARAMVSQRTNNIGVIIYRQHHPIASHPFYGKILDAILIKSESLGYSVFVTTDKEMSMKSADFMLEKRVDGLILISRLSQQVIGHIDTFNVPYLSVNGTTEKNDVIQIINNDRQGGRLVADHLYQLGHRVINVIAGPQNHRSHKLRFTGFCERLTELGGQIQKSDIYYSPTSTFEDGYQIIKNNWNQFSSRKPTAIFATNDMLAIGAMQLLLEKGLIIPNDLAIAGFDNIDYSKMSFPPLTTVHVEKERMGEDAVVLLDKLIKKEKVQKNFAEYEPKLVIRKSTV
ncbi:LacI family DNA-binding transcriptional regulator [Neobacillus sp. SM06]|uniref:LacI family DNA-binding transcriptional regulator n=1 Tax=Neobacillus sp. SM06 TaxID=3422492 RepID=UPI003D2D8629